MYTHRRTIIAGCRHQGTAPFPLELGVGWKKDYISVCFSVVGISASSLFVFWQCWLGHSKGIWLIKTLCHLSQLILFWTSKGRISDRDWLTQVAWKMAVRTQEGHRNVHFITVAVLTICCIAVNVKCTCVFCCFDTAQDLAKEQRMNFGDDITTFLRIVRKKRWMMYEEKRIQQEIELQHDINSLLTADKDR